MTGPAPRASFELWASRLTGGIPELLRRVPFTATIVLGTLVAGIVARTVWSPIWRASWFAEVAYGVPALREGKVWTLLTGWWFYLTPGQYLSGLVTFAVIVGACEIRLGTRAVAIAAVAGQIGGILLASLVVWALDVAHAHEAVGPHPRVGTSLGRKLLALASGLVIVAATASQINNYFAYYPTVGALTGGEAEVSALTGTAQRPSQAVTTPVVERWTGPATGTSQVVTASIPGTVSGFTARDAYIYLPAAYSDPSPPLLPVLILVSGQPGGPQDWITAGNLQAQLDRFAAANDGLAPVAVVVDPNGPNDTITLCMDSNIAKADTYLSQDVPNWITAELGVDANHAHWAFGGFSYGGTCAVQMATRHPDLYPSFIDISGEREPAVSSDRTQTVQAAFGGDTAQFDALTPLTLLSQRQYPDVWGFFSVGSNDPEFVQEMTEVSTAAQQAGMTVKIDPVPNQGHSWAVPAAALLPALEWLAPRLGLAREAAAG